MSQPLTPAQEQVITLLAEGFTHAIAAQVAGVHRNTITNWRRTSPAFANNLAAAHYDRVLYFRELAEQHAELAISTIGAILADPHASPSVRLKAALAIMKQATTLPPPEPAITDAAHNREIEEIIDPALLPADCAQSPELENMHNSAQSEPIAVPTTYRRAAPKTGRNEPCPCNSGRKYKQCCLMTMAA